MDINIKRRRKVNLAIRYIEYFTGHWYKWGGDDPSGFDCCIPDNEIIYTPHGGKFINDLKINDTVYSINKSLIPSKSKIVAIQDNGIKNCVNIRTNKRKICFSNNHPILVYRPFKAQKGAAWTVKNNAKLQWINASLIKRNDWIVVTKNLQTKIDKSLTIDQARFLGVFLADGHINGNRHLHLALFDDNLRKKYSFLMKKAFNYQNKITYHNTHGIIFYSVLICNLFNNFGMNVYAHRKQIPEIIFNASDECKYAFIDGYLDGDGYKHIRSRNGKSYRCNHFAASSEILIKQFHLLLTFLNEQISSVTISKRPDNLVINGKKIINAKPLYRFDWYPENKRNKASNLLIKNFHSVVGLSKDFRMEKIKKVEICEQKHTYNLTVSPHSTFIVGGIVTHNSGLAIEMLKSVGLLPRQYDTTAAGLYRMFPKVQNPKRGCLVFYGSKHISHVEICLNSELSLGASGGGSKTKTVHDAIKQNAFIKMRPIKRNRKIWGYCDPFKQK